MLYKDNRDIRDRGYKGELIIESNDEFAVSKDEALEKMKSILIGDRDYAQSIIDEKQEIVDACNLRLLEL